MTWNPTYFLIGILAFVGAITIGGWALRKLRGSVLVERDEAAT